jgi:hypothetical protein
VFLSFANMRSTKSAQKFLHRIHARYLDLLLCRS